MLGLETSLVVGDWNLDFHSDEEVLVGAFEGF